MDTLKGCSIIIALRYFLDRSDLKCATLGPGIYPAFLCSAKKYLAVS